MGASRGTDRSVAPARFLLSPRRFSRCRAAEREAVCQRPACWLWLQDEAARDARWLEDPETGQPYLPFERIVDQRNEAPRVIAYYNDPHPGFGEIGVEPVADLPALQELLPRVIAVPPVQKQPYRIIFTGEKSSLGRRAGAAGARG